MLAIATTASDIERLFGSWITWFSTRPNYNGELAPWIASARYLVRRGGVSQGEYIPFPDDLTLPINPKSLAILESVV